MKSKFLKIAFVIAVAMVGSINVFNAQKSEALSDVALAEVEALANTEQGCVNGPNCWVYCFVENGRYSCEDYWIWNCITEIN